jgi:ADP-ribose pyrophosphatase YjhB (NUDIX family)
VTHPLQLFAYCPKCGSGKFEINDEKSKKCTDCKFVYYFNASAAVVAFITDNDGRLLVCRRAKDPVKGTLDLPGGFIDLYETAEVAIAREVKEETNLEISESRYLFSIPNIYPYSGLSVHTVDMFFECKVKAYAEPQANDDVAECFFIPGNEVDSSLFGLPSIKKGIEVWRDLHVNI